MRWPAIFQRHTPGTRTRGRVPQGTAGREPGDKDSWWETADREMNPDLAGRARYAVLDVMHMSDPVVSGSMFGVKLAIGGADWSVQPGGHDPVDRFVADAAAHQLGLGETGADRWLEGGFDGLLWTMMLALDYGSMTGETVWGDEVVEWRDADGAPHGLIPLARLAPRYPHTLDDYVAGRGPSQPLASVRQDGIRRPLDGSRLVHIVHQPHMARFVGSPLMRPAYGVWKLKRQVLITSGFAYDRHASGTPRVRYPTAGGDEAKAKAMAIGRGHRAHELGFVALPGKPPSADEEGWDFDIVTAGALPDPIPLLRHYDEQIVSAPLERFLMLGSTETGSRAVGEVLAEPFYQALNWHAGRVADVIAEQLLRRWVTVNFGEHVATPRVVCGTIQQRNLPIKGRFLAEAAAAGVDFTDRVAQDEIRSWADILPHEPAYTRPEGTRP